MRIGMLHSAKLNVYLLMLKVEKDLYVSLMQFIKSTGDIKIVDSEPVLIESTTHILPDK